MSNKPFFSFIPAAAILLLLCAALRIQAEAKEPLPSGPEAYTQKKFQEDRLEYYQRILDTYSKRTEDPQNLQASARELLEIDCKGELGLVSQEERGKSFELGKKLVDEGSKDPLVLMATATAACYAQRPWEEAVHYFKRSQIEIAESSYPAREKTFVWTRSWVYHHVLRNSIQGKSKPPRISTTPLKSAFLDWIEEEADNKQDQRQFWLALERVINPPDPSRPPNMPTNVTYHLFDMEFLVSELEKLERQDSWLYQLAKGKLLFHEGHNPLRVAPPRPTPEEKLKQAAVHFKAAWKLNPKVPEAWDDLITLARDDHTEEEPRYWFDQCVAAQFDFSPAYTKYRTTLRPFHGGSEEALLRFGWECAQTERYDTAVPFELMECLSAIEQIAGVDAQVYRRPGVFDAVHQLCKGSLTSPVFAGQPQSDTSRGWIRATMLAIAARAQRLEDVGDLWEKVDEKQLQRAFQMYHVSTPPQIIRALGQAVTNIGPDLYDVQVEIEQIVDLRTAQSAQRALTAAIRDFETENLSWCIYWSAALDQMVRFYEGEWVDVTYFDKLPDFLGLKQWEVESKNSVLSTGAEPLHLQWFANLNSPLEFSVDLSTIKLPLAPQLAGILVGKAASRHERRFGILFGINSKQDIAGAAALGTPSPYHVKLKEKNHLEVQAWDGYWILTINGVRIARLQERGFSPDGNFVLWCPVPSPEMAIRYENLRVRKIPYNSPPEVNEHEARRLYYTDRIDEEDENHNHYFDRAEACMALGDREQAMKDYRRVVELRPDWIHGQLQLGALLEIQGKYQEAMDIYQSTLKDKPDSHATLNRIAWLQATAEDEKFRDPREAIRNASKAHELDTRNKSYWTTQIAAYIAHKEYSNAADLMKRRMKFHDGKQEEILKQLQEAIDTEGEFHPYRP